jgi:hypothetical protein
MRDNRYRLFLYKPTAAAYVVDNAGYRAEFIGELKADNVSMQLKLQDISTLSFDLPENILGAFNTRLDEVLEGYIVELWYGDLTGALGSDQFPANGDRVRFIIVNSRLEYSDGVKKFSYDANSIEHVLEFKHLIKWPGIKVKDFYRTVQYDDANTRFKEAASDSDPDHTYTISTSENSSKTKYITIPTTTASTNPPSTFDIFIYEYRRSDDDSENSENSIIEYIPIDEEEGVDEEGFKRGFYLPELDANGKVTALNIALPDDIDEFDAANTNFEFFVYDNPLSRHFAIGVNTDEEIGASDMYLDLAQDAEDGDAAEYGDYAFTTQEVYSINGLKLEHILLGTQESRTDDNIDNTKLTTDGILYDTGFTIGEIEEDIAAKYRSNIELNNTTKYEAIKSLAESFDCIAIFNSIDNTISFYPDKNEEVFTNRGLIITKENYLKNINNNIDAKKIITKAYGAGKDNIGLELITPNGGAAWEDYSYFLDSYYVEYDGSNILTIQSDETTGIVYDSFPTGTISRWMDSTEALNIAKWQYARDYFHDVMLGQYNPTGDPDIGSHSKYYNLYNLRSEAINKLVKEETKYFEIKAQEYKYKYLYEHYVKSNDNAEQNSRQKNFVYKFSSSTTVADPGSTFFRLNTNDFRTVTQIVIDIVDNTSVDRALFLGSVTRNNNPRITLSDVADVANGEPTNYITYKVVDATSYSGYVVLDVVYVNRTQSGITFTSNNPINLNFQTYEEIYKIKYDDAIAASTTALAALDSLHYEIYNTKFDGTIDDTTYAAEKANSFATKILEVQGFLDKSNWSIHTTKLKAFEKDVVMSDSKLDNELDLLTAVQEFVKENCKPIVTIDIDVVDILGSEQSSVDWNKVKIGDVVNIYYPDFNIDTTAQLREISIDFQSNALKFVISTYRQYGRTVLNFIAKQIRREYDNSTNKTGFKHDETKVSNERSLITNKKLERAGFAAEQAPIKLGAKGDDGTTSTEISGEGFVSKTISVNPVLDTFTASNTKTLTIADGATLARNTISASLTSEVEMSGDNGLVVRKVDAEGISTKQVYIDTDGNAIFSGFVSVNQDNNVGYDQQGVFIGEDNGVSKFSLVSGNTSMVFDPSATDYKLKILGEAKIGPLTLGAIGSTFLTGIVGSANPKISSGFLGPNILTEDYTFTASEITTIAITHVLQQFGGTITGRTISIQLLLSSSQVYPSSGSVTINIPDTAASNLIEDAIFDIPNINTDTIRVTITGTVSGGGATGWSLQQPKVTIPSADIKMGNFIVDSQGIMSTIEATFGNSSRDRIRIAGSNTINTPFISTIKPSDITEDRDILVPDSDGTMLLSTFNDGLITDTTSSKPGDIYIVARRATNSNINIIASNNIRLKTVADITGDIELNSIDNIELIAGDNVDLVAADKVDIISTNGTFIKRSATFLNNTAETNDGILILPNNIGVSSRRITLTTPSTSLTSNKTITLPDAAGTISLMQSGVANMYIGRIWTRSYNTHTWALRRDDVLSQINTDGTYSIFNLGYLIVDDSNNADVIKIEIVGNTTSASASRAFVEISAGTFQMTQGIALLSYTAYDAVSSNVLQPIQFLAQARTNGSNLEVRRPTYIKMSGGVIV